MAIGGPPRGQGAPDLVRAGESASVAHLGELSRDVAGYLGIVALTHALGLIQVPLLTRGLSVVEFGAYDLLATLVTLTALSLRLSLPEALSRYFQKSTPTELRRLTSTLVWVVFATGAVVCMCVWPFLDLVSSALFRSTDYSAAIEVVCLTGWVQAVVSIPRMRLRLGRRLRALAALEVGRQVVFLAVLAWPAVSGMGRLDVERVFCALLVAESLALMAGLIAVRHEVTSRPTLVGLPSLLRFGMPLLPARLLGWIGNQVPRFALLGFGGLAEVAVFGAGMRLAHLALIGGVIFERAWQPYAMLLVESRERDRVYRRVLTLFAAGAAALGVLVVAVAPEVLALLAPNDYAEAVLLLPLLIGGMALRQSIMFTRLGIFVREKTSAQAVAQGVTLVVTSLASLLLVWTLGAVGAALAFFLSGLVLTGLLGRMSARLAGLHFDLRAIGGILGIYLVASIGIVWAYRVLPYPGSPLARAAVVMLAVGGIATVGGLGKILRAVGSRIVNGRQLPSERGPNGSNPK